MIQTHPSEASRLEVAGEGIVRVRSAPGPEAGMSTLERYRVVDLPAGGPCPDGVKLARDGGLLEFALQDGEPLRVRLTEGRIEVSLAAGECLYGLGDASRDSVQRRGQRLDVWVRNVASYAPTPFVMSSAGWGLFVNTTRRTQFDLGATDPDRLVVTGEDCQRDVVVFTGPSMPDVLAQYTAVVGRPALLPRSAYGLTYVCNQQVDARDMLDEALRMREGGFPCDTIGLEPGWMETRYDYTTAKSWHPERFHIPGWMLDPRRKTNWAEAKPHTFLGALERLKLNLSLWLCCDYDLSHEAERRARGATGIAPLVQQVPEAHADDVEQDVWIQRTVAADQVTDPAEPWFEHLKKFVDQGVSAFKLDGANQVMEHPDRLWGNGMHDDEMHNLYPVLLGQQMYEGFSEHTGRRPFIYSACGYAGSPQFAATWAGDTGGGPRPLVSMLNHGLSGHSNTSCDMDVFTRQGIHFGFLQPWSQLCSWAYWRQPWLLGDQLEPVFRFYARLRYQLLPYLYSTAWTAHRTGMPMLRAMALAFPADRDTHNASTQYMLGDWLLVGAFTDEVVLPAGEWIDFWSGERHQGPGRLQVEDRPDRGGVLLIRSGALVPVWADATCAAGTPTTMGIDHHPGPPSRFVLYEDDGTTLRHAEGEFATTTIIAATLDGRVTMTIEPRQGAYDGMPIERAYDVRIHAGRALGNVTINDALITPPECVDGVTTIRVPEDPRRRDPITIVADLA